MTVFKEEIILKNYKLILFFSIFILIFILMMGCSNDKVELKTEKMLLNSAEEEIIKLTMEEKLEDFEYLYKVIGENYPYFEVKKRRYGINWLDYKDKFLEMIKNSKDDHDFINQVQYMMSQLKNGHSYLLESESYYSFKETYTNYENGRNPWIRVLQREKTIDRYKWMEREFNVNLNDSESMGEPDINLETKILREDDIAYLKIKSFSGFNIEEDKKTLKEFYSKIKDYPYLIIDIRGNSGGSDMYWIENIIHPLNDKTLESTSYILYRGDEYISFLEHYAVKQNMESHKDLIIDIDKLPENPNYPPEIYSDFNFAIENHKTYRPNDSKGYSGKLYLLVDERVYSSAESFASFTKESKFATLVGTVTKGDGVTGAPLLFSLPNSGLIIQIPSGMGLNPDGTANEEKGTIPDVIVGLSSKALDKALELIELDKKNIN